MPCATRRDPIYSGRRFSVDVIELSVRWYITYRLSYRDLAAMMAERGVAVTHTTIMRWVLRYVPEYEKRWARFARLVGSLGGRTRLRWRSAAGRIVYIGLWTGKADRSIHYSAAGAQCMRRRLSCERPSQLQE